MLDRRRIFGAGSDFFCARLLAAELAFAFGFFGDLAVCFSLAAFFPVELKNFDQSDNKDSNKNKGQKKISRLNGIACLVKPGQTAKAERGRKDGEN